MIFYDNFITRRIREFLERHNSNHIARNVQFALQTFKKEVRVLLYAQKYSFNIFHYYLSMNFERDQHDTVTIILHSPALPVCVVHNVGTGHAYMLETLFIPSLNLSVQNIFLFIYICILPYSLTYDKKTSRCIKFAITIK